MTAALEKLRFTDEESDAVINLSASEIGGVVRAIRPVVEQLVDDAYDRGWDAHLDYEATP